MPCRAKRKKGQKVARRFTTVEDSAREKLFRCVPCGESETLYRKNHKCSIFGGSNSHLEKNINFFCKLSSIIFLHNIVLRGTQLKVV